MSAATDVPLVSVSLPSKRSLCVCATSRTLPLLSFSSLGANECSSEGMGILRSVRGDYSQRKPEPSSRFEFSNTFKQIHNTLPASHPVDRRVCLGCFVCAPRHVPCDTRFPNVADGGVICVSLHPGAPDTPQADDRDGDEVPLHVVRRSVWHRDELDSLPLHVIG